MLTPEHREQRRAFLGSSDVPQVLGYSTFGGPWRVWVSKVRPDLEPPNKPDPVTTLGSMLEPWLRRQLAAMVEDVTEVAPAPMTTRDGWMAASPDGQLSGTSGQLGVAELKTEGGNPRWDGWGMPGTDQVRKDYLLQTAWQMAVTGLSRADVCVLGLPRTLQVWLGDQLVSDPYRLPWVEGFLDEALSGGLSGVEVRVYHCHRSMRLERALTAKAWAWWARHVVDGHPPPNNDEATCQEALARIYPPELGCAIEARGGLRMAAKLYGKTRAERERLQRQEGQLLGLLKRRMGPNTELTDGDEYIATWRETKSGSRPFRWRGYEDGR